jgi:hypothetical protein
MGGAQYRWGDASEVELDGSVGSARLMWGGEEAESREEEEMVQPLVSLICMWTPCSQRMGTGGSGGSARWK